MLSASPQLSPLKDAEGQQLDGRLEDAELPWSPSASLHGILAPSEHSRVDTSVSRSTARTSVLSATTRDTNSISTSPSSPTSPRSQQQRQGRCESGVAAWLAGHFGAASVPPVEAGPAVQRLLDRLRRRQAAMDAVGRAAAAVTRQQAAEYRADGTRPTAPPDRTQRSGCEPSPSASCLPRRSRPSQGPAYTLSRALPTSRLCRTRNARRRSLA